MWRGGVLSGGRAELSTAAVSVRAAGLAAASGALLGSDELLCVQPYKAQIMTQKTNVRVMGAKVLPRSGAVLMDYCDDLEAAASRRARLRLGCTSQATPMLTRYSATIGAAKMHMFMMSVVGVTMAAMMKIIRME